MKTIELKSNVLAAIGGSKGETKKAVFTGIVTLEDGSKQSVKSLEVTVACHSNESEVASLWRVAKNPKKILGTARASFEKTLSKKIYRIAQFTGEKIQGLSYQLYSDNEPKLSLKDTANISSLNRALDVLYDNEVLIEDVIDNSNLDFFVSKFDLLDSLRAKTLYKRIEAQQIAREAELKKQAELERRWREQADELDALY